MVRYSRSLIVTAVTAALALPATLAAQTAIPRNGGSTSSGSSSGTSGGGTSSGGGDVGSGGSSAGSRVSPPSMPSFPTDNRRPSSSSSSRSGSTSSRGGSATGDGDGYSGPGTTRSGSAISRGGYTGGAGAGSSMNGFGGSRSRGERPTTCRSMDRPPGYVSPNYNLYFPVDPFSPWGRWYPWYYGGFGYGYLSFDPWRYGTSRYSMFRYGAWYNPYDPWCYGVGYWLCDPWGGATTSSYGGSSRDYDEEEEPTASVRLRVSPDHAQVFVDGALVGTVDDFNGLSDHLKLTVAEHLVEIKADGYETFVPKLDIEAGKTLTVRGSLKKIK